MYTNVICLNSFYTYKRCFLKWIYRRHKITLTKLWITVNVKSKNEKRWFETTTISRILWTNPTLHATAESCNFINLFWIIRLLLLLSTFVFIIRTSLASCKIFKPEAIFCTAQYAAAMLFEARLMSSSSFRIKSHQMTYIVH